MEGENDLITLKRVELNSNSTTHDSVTHNSIKLQLAMLDQR